MIKIGIHGSTGRMGVAVNQVINSFCDCKLVYQYAPSLKDSFLESLCKQSDVVVDFSSSEGIDELLNQSLTYKTKLVIGTTNFSDIQKEKIIVASKEIPIVWSSNMSIGITLLSFLLKNSVTILDNFDVNIIDIHHRNKKDAPSGTAIMLAQVINEEIKSKVNFSSLRCGDSSGEHQILFSGEGEQLIFTHKTTSQNPYAYGAILAAIWVANKEVGLYNMIDVFNLK